MGNYNFNKDVILGEEGEKEVVNFLEKLGAKFIGYNKNNSHDLVFDYKGEEVTYEVKTDVYCTPSKDTGNLFVEFECRGKASGIMVTKAKWYVNYYKYLKQIWFIKSDDLLRLISENNFYQTSQSGDKGSNTKGYLIKRGEFKKHFIVKQI